MQKRVQIVVMEKGGNRWKFIAHGAPYSREDAEALKTRRLSLGDKVRFLTVGKE